MTQSIPSSPLDRLAVGYQLKIHLLGIRPQINLAYWCGATPPWPSGITSAR